MIIIIMIMIIIINENFFSYLSLKEKKNGTVGIYPTVLAQENSQGN